MTLSVCCLAGDPPAQVVAVLQALRSAADEIVVAVDSRLDPDSLGPYDGVVDLLFRYEFGLHPDRARPWLYAQCHGDWIFSIDADEVPSAALVDELPSLIGDPDVAQYEFPRRWLYPDAATWLDELPWWPDFQNRLVRAGPHVRHSGRLHDRLELVLPALHLALPIYHLALVTADEAERRGRSARYDEHASGRLAYGGGLLNATMYLPEETATAIPRPVPAVDRASIEAVLAARLEAAAGTHPPLPLPVVRRAEIDRHVQPTELTDDDYGATLSAYAESGRMVPGEVRPVYVWVRNDSTVPWPWGGTQEPTIVLGYHWVDRDGAHMPDDGRRGALTATLRPGESQIVPIFVQAPEAAGRHVLEIDVVHEPVRWFGRPLTLDMQVDATAPGRAAEPSPTMLITTIVARNYVPRARLLARSFLRHHPGGRVSVLVIDADAADRWDEAFEVLTLEDLPLATRECHLMAAIYDVTELATAVKPFLLRHLLFDRGEPSVTYLDPDIEVFGPLDHLDALARTEDIVLTPHRLDDVPDDGYQPDARSLSASGVFNLGFISVGQGAKTFLERWSEHCRRDCIVAHDQGLFVDQRWVDRGVVPFRHHVVTDPGCNVAYWNVDSRPLTEGDNGFEVAGRPLRFFHYSGFRLDRPHLLSSHQGVRPRTLLSEHPPLAELVDGYGRGLEAAGLGWADREYGWARTAGGLRLDPLIRRILRDELLRRERDTTGRSGSSHELPDVFAAPDDEALLRLLRSPLPGSPVPNVGRYLHHIYLERPDVQQAYPNLRGQGLAAFHAWVRRNGRHEHEIPDALLPTNGRPAVVHHAPLRRGVNIIGYFTAELGLGEAGRAMLATLEHLGEPCAVINEDGTANRQDHPPAAMFGAVEDYDINLLCVNSDQVPRVVERLRDRLRSDQYTVGLWAWELEEFPPSMRVGVPFVDEVWTYSGHASSAISRAVDIRVHVVPLPVIEYEALAPGAQPLPIDAAFTFLFCYDAHSIIERKNPLGVIEAFSAAFRPGEGPVLLVKSINGRSAVTWLERLRSAAAGRPDIHVIDRYLDVGATRALIERCDCYVSLHRAEGFGYTMAEAMLAGKPVIATAYSGNLQFMDEDNSFLVRAGRSLVPEGCGPYPAGAVWAEPDLEDAARLMRLVHDDAAARARVGAWARRDIVDRHSPAAMVPLVLVARLAEIRASARAPVTALTRGPVALLTRSAWQATRQVAARLRA